MPVATSTVHTYMYIATTYMYMLNQLTKFWSKAPRNEVVSPASLDLAISADGRHGEGGDSGDHGCEEDDEGGQSDARLAHHPAQTNEQHHTPDVQQAADLRGGKYRNAGMTSTCTCSRVMNQ